MHYYFLSKKCWTFKTHFRKLLAVVAIGYADGVSRNLSGKISASIDGVLVPQVGEVPDGEGSKELTDQIDEHAKMHELGIAHGHEGRRAVMTQKAQEQDYPQHKHD